MESSVTAFSTVDELAAYVHGVLCEKDNLEAKQTPLYRTPLVKRGRDCGMVFHVEGPRLLRTSAVWTADADRIIFYDSTGTRFRTVELSEGPAMDVAKKAA
jgi:hypothetical protein